MHRNQILSLINAYNPEFLEEKEFRISFLSFIQTHSNCFERTLLEGHITGSAWIVNQSMTKVLLSHHRKLDRWLQLGGHADGDGDILRVAQREAIEESGLTTLSNPKNEIFDIDIHTIPARKKEPEHLHYDVRFLFVADDNEQLRISYESKNLQWIPFDNLKHTTKSNDSILRMARKSTKLLRIAHL